MNPSNLFDYKDTPLSPSLAENVSNIETVLGKSSDLLLNPFFYRKHSLQSYLL